MQKVFRVNNNQTSSYFDLLSGDHEVKQTKSLGFLLANSMSALQEFFEIYKIKNAVHQIDWGSIQRVIVNCELPSKNHESRADILIRLYKKKKFRHEPFLAVIIEAKSSKSSVSPGRAAKQLNRYIASNTFHELDEFKENKIIGVTLTKYPSGKDDQKLISVTWSDVVEKFYYADKTNDILLNEYFKFMTNIGGSMKFYEQDVYSIPTQDWSNEAVKRFHIYECPNKGRYIMKKKPLYLTFRKSGGGEMHDLYKIEEIIILHFQNDFALFMENERIEANVRERVKSYTEYMIEKGIWSELPSDEKQVFILSESETIELKNKPKPKRNNSYRKYYTLSDILNKEVI